MFNYTEYLNLYGLSFKIGFDRGTDTEWNNDCKLVFGIDYYDIPIFYSYWGNYMSFIEEI